MLPPDWITLYYENAAPAPYRPECLIYVQLARGRKTKNKTEQSETSDSHEILQNFFMSTEGLRTSGSVQAKVC